MASAIGRDVLHRPKPYEKQEENCALTAYFVMVALDKDGKAAKIPQLEVTNEIEAAKFEEGKRIYEEIKARPRVCWLPFK